MLIGGSGTGTTKPSQSGVSSTLNASDFQETGSYHNLQMNPLQYGWGALLPDDYDNNLFDLQDFDVQTFMNNWNNMEQDYDYSDNIQSLYMALNTYRLNLTIL